MNKRLPEILAPAGDLSCLKAAISSGCDAVYFGGEVFNARRNAGNFSLKDIQEAVRICRLHGVKTNFTLNILVKDAEWDTLENYLDQILPLGIDALIIQDIGVARAAAKKILEKYPYVQLHGSTQMAVEDADGARYLKELGFSRVVLARELTLDEIREITATVDIETEVFIHGALCYSDSGRCLLSSFHGGRSGNRGTCAQVCRLQYIADGRKEFYMNLKDRCTIECMNELIEAGVRSFKIEGRMKGIPYVTAVTGFYREMLDAYSSHRSFDSLDEKLEEVKQVFNRGDFTEGYYRTKKENMIEKGSVKHQGVVIGRVQKVKDRSILVKSERVLHSGDELEIVTSGMNLPIRLSEGMLSRDHFSASFRLAGKIREGQKVRRIVDPVLHQTLRDRSSIIPRIPVDLSLIARKGQPLQIQAAAEGVKVFSKGAPVEEAQKAPVTQDQLIRLLSRTGETFEARSLAVDMDEDIFVPVAQINTLRRDVIGKLEDKRLIPSLDKKILEKTNAAMKAFALGDLQHDEPEVQTGAPVFVISLDEPSQWEGIRRCDLSNVKALVLSMEGAARLSLEERSALIHEIRTAAPHAILSIRLPRVGRMIHQDWVDRELALWRENGIEAAEACRMGQLYHIQKIGMKASLGPDMGVMNRESALFYASAGMEFSISREMSIDEMQELLRVKGASCVLYGRVPYMVSEQCIYKERHECHKDPVGHAVLLKDRQDEEMTVISHCPLCYSEIFSGRPVYPSEPGKLISSAHTLRIELTDETPEEISEILPSVMRGESLSVRTMEGHFIKGVE